MTKPLHASYVTIVEGSKVGFRPQYFACLHGKSLGSTRIELYRTEEQANSQQPAPRLIVIKPNTHISVNKEKHSFTISNSSIVTTSDTDLRQWLTKIYQAQPTVKGLSEYSLQIYDEINDPKNDLGPFMVTLQQSESLSFYGPCQIEIQPKSSDRLYFVCVYDMNQPPRLIIRWQIDHLRGYGSNESVLKIQTGRRTATGVSTFIFQTSDGLRIHQAIHHWAEIITNHNPSLPAASPPFHADIPQQKPPAKLPPKPTSTPPRGVVKGGKELVMQNSSAYQPLIAPKKPAPVPTYESMRRSPSASNSMAVDTTDNPTGHYLSNDDETSKPYESLNVQAIDKGTSVYEGLHKPSQGASKHEDLNSKSSVESTDNYAKLGARDEPKPSYMTINHKS